MIFVKAKLKKKRLIMVTDGYVEPFYYDIFVKLIYYDLFSIS